MYPEHIGKSLQSKMTTLIWFIFIFINWDRLALIKNKHFVSASVFIWRGILILVKL